MAGGWPFKEKYTSGKGLFQILAGDMAAIGRILNKATTPGLTLARTRSGIGWKLELKTDGITIGFAPDGVTLKVPDGGIDKTKIAADVAGAGLVQAVGGELDVNVDNSTLEVSGDTVQVKGLGVDTPELAALAVTTAKIDANAVLNTKTTGFTGVVVAVPFTFTFTNGLCDSVV